MEVSVDPEITQKNGPELFRELLRLLPTLEPDDYCKHGMWQNELMRLDVQILAAHRTEAGAPDPPPLESVKLPETPAPPLGMAGWSQPLQMVSPAHWGGQPIRPKMPVQAAPMPPSAISASSSTADAAGQLQHVAQFINKWGFDRMQAGGLLARLSPARRVYVMAHFQEAGAAGGGAVTQRLEAYIRQCEATNAWVAADAAAPQVKAAPKVVAPPSASALLAAGVKRPFEQTDSIQCKAPPMVAPAASSVSKAAQPAVASSVSKASAAAGGQQQWAPPQSKAAPSK